MAEEVFRAHNVGVNANKRVVLENLSLNLYRGEILGVYGPFSISKAAILGLISREIYPSSGAVFFYGKKYDGIWDDGVKTPKVFFVSGEETFIGAMSLWENMLALRPYRRELQVLSAKSMKRYLSVLLREYGIELSPDATLGSLSPVMRFMLELIKAKLQKADVALASDFFPEGSREEMTKLRLLMRRLAGEGMSVVLTSHRFYLLKEFADRIAFMSKETVIKCAPVTQGDDDFTERIFARLSDDKELAQPQSHAERDLKPLHSFERLGLYGGGALTLHCGELTEILRASGSVVEEIASAPAENSEILCVRSPVTPFVIRELTVEENLCLRQMGRIAARGVVRPERIKVLLQEFVEWYGNDSLLGLQNCLTLDRHNLIAIALFQLIIQRPRVLVYLDMRKDMDNISRLLMMRAARVLTEKGGAVCFVDTNYGDYECTADRSFFVGNDGKLRLASKRYGKEAAK